MLGTIEAVQVRHLEFHGPGHLERGEMKLGNCRLDAVGAAEVRLQLCRNPLVHLDIVVCPRRGLAYKLEAQLGGRISREQSTILDLTAGITIDRGIIDAMHAAVRQAFAEALHSQGAVASVDDVKFCVTVRPR